MLAGPADKLLIKLDLLCLDVLNEPETIYNYPTALTASKLNQPAGTLAPFKQPAENIFAQQMFQTRRGRGRYDRPICLQLDHKQRPHLPHIVDNPEDIIVKRDIFLHTIT